jgi:ABC-type dipeptide/oligopeptide/nickel transport system ATPase component
MENNILVIGIAGGTGSGKTTLMKNIIDKFGDVVTVLSHDNYYRRRDELTYEQRCLINYDEPAALETELMAMHLDKLRHGEAIDCPVYDFTRHNRSDETVRVVPKNVIIVEDIIDSGRTLSHLKDLLSQRHPKTMKICTLLDKPDRRVVDVDVEYVGFQIPDEFVVGYGLDYAQKYRNLPYIGILEFVEED